MRKVYVGEDYKRKLLVGGVYCGGTLEDEAGYDFVWVNRRKDFDTSEHIEDVIAVLPNGEERAARLFVWHREWFGLGGFVVDVNDTEYLAHAQEKFDQRARNI